MCEVCKSICKQIEKIFGHKVDPVNMENLIENSPLSKSKEKKKWKEEIIMAKTTEELERELAREKAFSEAQEEIEEIGKKKKKLAKEIRVVKKQRQQGKIIRVIKKLTKKPETKKIIRVQ